MKLILAVVQNDDSSAVNSTLNDNGFMVTKLATTGGFLRSGNTTFIICTDDDRVNQVIELIKRDSCRRKEVVPTTVAFDINQYSAYPVEITVGGATIMVLNVEQFVKV